ncbi:MAG TPA: hypothetical protein VFK59_09970 [Actinomycetota bacterium]|jgi:hypothetical protein|nr:hypothetical protein [Actinomycetota bacterium]
MPDEREPIFGYPVLSDGQMDAKNPNRWTETVWEWTDSWEPAGDPIGSVTIVDHGATEGFTATFDFKGPPFTIVTGKVPTKDGRRWNGKGRATARKQGREDKEIDIEFVNPKKWG